MKKLTMALALSAFAFAGNSNTGCGLGYYFNPNPQTLAQQVLVITTNNISFQSFAITTGSHDCVKPSRIVKNDVIRFVQENMDALAVDVANGRGESVYTLAEMLEVTDKEAFAVKLQNNFSVIYANENATSAEVIDAIISLS